MLNPKQISFSLSVKSVKNAIKELKQYQQEIVDKNELFVKRIKELGEKVMLEKVHESPLGNTVYVSSEISSDKTGCQAILYLSGGYNQPEGRETFYFALAIEFGAGIHYNSGKGNPYANPLDFGVGSYPGQVHAFEDTWYYWDETEEKWKPTHGVKATMPMYNAMKKIMEDVEKVAREIFEDKSMGSD